MRKKCSFCKKKIGMIVFTCRCKGEFCVKHQTAHSHSCKNDEKGKEVRKTIEKNNPSVEKKKVSVI